MSHFIKRNFIPFVALLFVVNISFAQVDNQNPEIIIGQEGSRVITTAVPFLSIAPDARGGALGDIGTSLSSDINGLHYNVGRLAHIENKFGFAYSLTPWLSNLVNDMYLNYLAGYTKLKKEQTIGFAIRYFDLGDMTFTDENGQTITDFNPNEFSIEGGYSQKLSERSSLGIALQFVYSNLTGNAFTGGGVQSRPGMSFGGDIGWYWLDKNKTFFGNPGKLAFGVSITDIGSKMTYSDDQNKQFIPTTLRGSGAITFDLDMYNNLTFSLELSKLMVPTPPVYGQDSTGTRFIVEGKDPNRGLISGMFGSFADAPGGFQEEMQEIMIGTGLEYWYNNVFAARLGYYWEHQNKGGRQFLTAGLGLRYNVFGIDFAYLVPFERNHPLAETLRFTLLFNFDGKQKSVQDQNN